MRLGNRKLWHIGLIIFGAYTALLLVNLPSVHYFNALQEKPADWWRLTLSRAWGMYLWVFITPFILWTGYVFRVTRPNLWRNVLIHLSVAILIGLVRPMLENAGLWALGLGNPESLQSDLLRTGTYIRSITGAIVTYPTVIGIQEAYLYYRESQERAFNLQQAELQMLKMQLHPHFFFNTLNAISALMYSSPKEADRMITQLGDLFRVSLRKDKAQEIPLKDELDFLKSFLQIHQTLMGKRLQVDWSIEPETLDALVPNLILQPLAENAIQHGVAPLEAGGRIEVRAARQNGSLLLEVRDDGLGFAWDNGAKKGGGIGLGNTRARLENLYNGSHKFSIDEPAEGGVAVRLEIPFKEAAEEK